MTVEFLLRLWLDCDYDSDSVGVCQQTHVISWNTVWYEARVCVCVCMCNTYSVGFQYELNNIARVVGQRSYCGARNQLTVVLQDRETDRLEDCRHPTQSGKLFISHYTAATNIFIINETSDCIHYHHLDHKVWKKHHNFPEHNLSSIRSKPKDSSFINISERETQQILTIKKLEWCLTFLLEKRLKRLINYLNR